MLKQQDEGNRDWAQLKPHSSRDEIRGLESDEGRSYGLPGCTTEHSGRRMPLPERKPDPPKESHREILKVRGLWVVSLWEVE